MGIAESCFCCGALRVPTEKQPDTTETHIDTERREPVYCVIIYQTTSTLAELSQTHRRA
jgi:hypothetical protein